MLLCQGEIASAFGDLLRKLWAPGASPVAPRIFKSKLARFAPQFSGFNQHDSQVSAFGPFFLCLFLLLYKAHVPCTLTLCTIYAYASFLTGASCFFIGRTS